MLHIHIVNSLNVHNYGVIEAINTVTTAFMYITGLPTQQIHNSVNYV